MEYERKILNSSKHLFIYIFVMDGKFDYTCQLNFLICMSFMIFDIFYILDANGMAALSRQDQQKARHNYKLIIDPMIHQRGGQKIYRFDGVDPAVR